MHRAGCDGKARDHQSAYGKSADRYIWKHRHVGFPLVINGLVPIDVNGARSPPIEYSYDKVIGDSCKNKQGPKATERGIGTRPQESQFHLNTVRSPASFIERCWIEDCWLLVSQRIHGNCAHVRIGCVRWEFDLKLRLRLAELRRLPGREQVRRKHFGL